MESGNWNIGMGQGTLYVVQLSPSDDQSEDDAGDAWNLHQVYRQRQVAASLVVGHKYSNSTDPSIIQMRNDEGKPFLTQNLLWISRRLKKLGGHMPATKRAAVALDWLAEPLCLTLSSRRFPSMSGFASSST